MNDLINRKKLLDDIDNLTFHATLSFPLKASKINEIKSIIQKLLDSIIEIIMNSPSESDWIPCSERLPKSVGNKVIVFCTGEDVNDYVGFGHYEKYEGMEVWLNLETGKQFAEWGLTVQKWMPMPDAYEQPKEGADNG